MNKPSKVVAMVTLAVWGLAAMHCTLERVPGFDFLKCCCFVDSAPSAPQDCEDSVCGEVETGKYRAEQRTTSAPQPPLVLALLSPVLEVSLPELQPALFVASESPPELPKVWQFSHRTALSPRAPSFVS